VRNEDYFGFIVEKVFNGRDAGLDTGIIEDAFFAKGNIVVNANKHGFAVEINVMQGQCAHEFVAIGT